MVIFSTYLKLLDVFAIFLDFVHEFPLTAVEALELDVDAVWTRGQRSAWRPSGRSVLSW